MSRIAKIAVAGGTFSVALGIGFVMQNGDALAARFGDAPPPLRAATAAAVFTQPDAGTAAGPAQPDAPADATVVAAMLPALPPIAARPDAPAAGLPSALLLPAEEAAPVLPAPAFPGPVAQAALEADPVLPDLTPGAPAPAAGPDCAVALSAEAGPAALVELTLAAPCAPLAQVTLHHQGMMVSAMTDADGRLTTTLPALGPNAVFIAELAGGEGAVAMVPVPDLADYDRAVLQWQGADGLMIHAREFGADYGSPGHVWHGAPRDAAAALAGEGGFLMRLGDTRVQNPLMAEVYTYPTGISRRSGAVALTVEAEITAANCGTDIAAQSLQIVPGQPVRVLDLTMTVPGCDALGQFLVLEGVLQDIALAGE